MNILRITLKGGRNIYVNFNLVTDFYQKGDVTMICFGDENYHFEVTEEADYIYMKVQLRK